VTVDVFGADEQRDGDVPLDAMVALVRSVLGAEGVRGGAEVSLLFVDEPSMASLNERFLGEEGPLQGGRAPDAGGTGPGEPIEEPMPELLGDVVVCPKVAAANAAKEGVGYDDELALLVVHGTLHLLGWDHEEDEEAEAMEARERELLRAHWSASWAGR